MRVRLLRLEADGVEHHVEGAAEKHSPAATSRSPGATRRSAAGTSSGWAPRRKTIQAITASSTPATTSRM
jgi:hypothetical protein